MVDHDFARLKSRVYYYDLLWQFAQVAIFLPSFSDDPGAKISSQSDTRRLATVPMGSPTV
jgi:hypothetical protein